MDLEISAEPTTNAVELSTALAWLGLSQYEERLTENGLESWETVTAITETDMTVLGFRLGDRRKPQRAIREHSNSTRSQLECGATHHSLSSRGLPVTGAQSVEPLLPPQPSARTRRPYRRHPRPDHNAPRKPKTDYVLFGEHVRKDPALSCYLSPMPPRI
jgi:hypothetical protein